MTSECLVRLGVLALLVFTLQAGEEHSLTLVCTSQLDGGVAHPVITTLWALPFYDGAVSILVVLLLLRGVFLAVEVDGVPDDLLVEELAGHDVLTAEAGDVSRGSEAREERATAGTEVNLRTEGLASCHHTGLEREGHLQIVVMM